MKSLIKLKVLELFCGTKSISKAFIKKGHKCFTVDFDKQFKPDLCINILDFDISMLPEEFKKPDIVWASPPCTSFSVASISHYWLNGRPKNSKCYIGIAIAKKTLEIIKELKPKYWFIENPRGMLRNLWFMQRLHRQTVTYCRYGDNRQKPTDIWSNINWISKKPCSSGANCHEAAKRGTNDGTQNLPSPKERAIIPAGLCDEIVKVCEEEQKIKQEMLRYACQ